MKRLLLSLFLGLVLGQTIHAQNALEASFHYGRILRNNPVFPEVKHNSTMLSVAWVRYTNGQHTAWSTLYRYPVFGLIGSYERMGNPERLGNVYALTPTLGFFLRRQERLSIQFIYGIGIAWLDRPYDKLQNPLNNVNGSHLNFSSLMRITADWKFSRHLHVLSSLAASHYSNGNVSTPNLGANLFSVAVGVRYFYQPPVLNVFHLDRAAALPLLDKRTHFFWRGSFGWTERALDGPKYPIYTTSIGINRLFGRINRVSTGVEYIFNSARYVFMQHLRIHENAQFKQASRVAWFLGHELLFGHLGFLTEAGVYLNKHYARRHIISTKIGFNLYYKNTLRHFQHLTYLGLHIHAYFGEAEFVAIALGHSF